MKPPSKKVPITSLPIHVYKPLTEGRPHLAYIGDLPMKFTGPTAMGVMRKAREWAKENCKFKGDTP